MDRNQGQRYRAAAEDALEQLNWCSGYLCGIRKGRIGRRLARNGLLIKRTLMREPAANGAGSADPESGHRRPGA